MSDAKKMPATEWPAGLASTLPGGDFKGTLVPVPQLKFDPPPESVRQALLSPGSLRVSWPIKGSVPHLHDLVMPCKLSWVVNPEADPKSRAAAVAGDTKLKIDGNGRFQIVVDGKDPTLDLIEAAVVNKGTAGFSVGLPDLPDAGEQTSPEAVPFDILCEVEVQVGADPRLGDRVVFTPKFHKVFNQAQLELHVAESDAGEGAGNADRPAEVTRDVSKRCNQACPWTIGFALGEEPRTATQRFGYMEQDEVGELEFVWTLFGKHPGSALPPTPLRVAAVPIKVKRLQLEALHVHVEDGPRHTWRVVGAISGYSTARTAPALSVVLMLVDRAGKTYPATREQALAVRLDKQGGFEQVIEGPPGVVSPDAVAGADAKVALGPYAPDAVTGAGAKVAFGPYALDAVTGAGAKVASAPYAPDAVTGAGAKVASAQHASVPAFVSPVFAIMGLAATWDQNGKSPGPIGGFLGFNEEKYALYKSGRGTGWTHDAEWVASEEFSGVAPRGPRPKGGEERPPAPGPQAGGDQFSALTIDDLWLDILAWEGFIPYLYKDHKGYMTVGTGNCLVTKDDPGNPAQTVALYPKFKNRDKADEVASKELIEETFKRVFKMPHGKGHPAESFQTHPNLELDFQDVRALFDARAQNEFLKHVRATIEKFDEYPKAARRVLFDVAYAGGAFCYQIKKYPGVTEAALGRNWAALKVALQKVEARPLRRQWREELLDYAQSVDLAKFRT
jgi:hypothetical protein